MAQKKSNPYLENMIMTASPQQLQMMLYDGVLRFIDSGKTDMTNGKWEGVHDNLTKARAIVAELMSGLKPKVAPELCSKLAALYVFVYQKLITGGTQRDTTQLDDALKVLRIQRDAWSELCAKLTAEQSTAVGGSGSPPDSDNKDVRLSIAV